MVTSDQDERREGPNVFLCFLPMFHIFGLSVITYAQLQRGNAIISMSRFDINSLMEAVQRHRVTHLFCVPPVIITLTKHGRAGKYDLSSLKLIGSGAAPLGKDVTEVVAKKFPDSEIVQLPLTRRENGTPVSRLARSSSATSQLSTVAHAPGTMFSGRRTLRRCRQSTRPLAPRQGDEPTHAGHSAAHPGDGHRRSDPSQGQNTSAAPVQLRRRRRPTQCVVTVQVETQG
ncbi:4-coumarate--CoA ligase-like 1 isoform X2 [Oryza glaberrima]|uniref:4-coumarate--CoA ligase-like 1 isoform X2 n=1 Tax=Oryza glaberrima TaxID=4538 RepID=UPI00224BF7E1|nr:4-coumarate--CoA ligase-like 1 isoform X2 [Oryza glaberrima]